MLPLLSAGGTGAENGADQGQGLRPNQSIAKSTPFARKSYLLILQVVRMGSRDQLLGVDAAPVVAAVADDLSGVRKNEYSRHSRGSDKCDLGSRVNCAKGRIGDVPVFPNTIISC